MVSILETFRQQLLIHSMSRDRLGRLASVILIQGEYSAESRQQAVVLFQEHGCSIQEAQAWVDKLVKIAASFDVRPGPITFGE